MKEVVVIGGGIVGLFCAYYLTKDGCKVTVIDQSEMNSGASYVNAGYISPSHVIPLASPGMVSSGLKMMFNAKSPFYLKPRFNKNLWQWAWHFNKAANQKHVDKTAPIIKEFTEFSRILYENLKAENPFDFHFEKKGVLMAYQSVEFEKKEAVLAEKAIELGLEVKTLSESELKIIEPEMEALGAYWYQCDAHSTPNQFMQNFIDYLISNGVQIIKNEEVTSFEMVGKKVKQVLTKSYKINTNELVIAAGSWSPLIAKKLGFKLLIEAGKGYRINSFRKLPINYPAILTDRNTAVTPMESFFRFGGTMEISGINREINSNRVKAIAEAVQAFYPSIHINNDEIKQAACGLRPVSPDGLPFIGRTKKFNNVAVAAGHAMLGWSQAPATGKIISEIINNKNLSIQTNLFNADRFN
ncbi:MAG: NAD(P)/FAD-dependent oxidoreductase [Lutibacter sp.]